MLYCNGFSSLSTLGASDEETAINISRGVPCGLRELPGYLPGGESAVLGILSCELPKWRLPLSRCARMLLRCFENILPDVLECIKRYGADRVGAVVGTSTGDSSDTEENARISFASEGKLDYDERRYERGTLSSFARQFFDIKGPCYSVCTACTSSALACISAAKLIESGICDAVVVAGADSLSAVSVQGFYSLGALSKSRCLPFHKDRSGINIAEGAAATILCKENLGHSAMKLLGWGATSDAYHASSPEPSGIYGYAAAEAALLKAGLSPIDIGYINAHGTGTQLNDAMEAKIAKLLAKDMREGKAIPMSSTKHLTGHTLGAAAIVEAYLCFLVFKYGLSLPYHPYAPGEVDPDFSDIGLVLQDGVKIEYGKAIMSNSFAFGGSNASMIFGAA